MPSCSKAVNPKGVEIVFTEDDHKYCSIIDGKEIVYTSGTTFVGKFENKFDPDGSIVARCASKNGITVEEQKRIWETKKNNSCEFGTRIHEICESIMKDRPYNLLYGDEFKSRVSKTAESTAKMLKDRIEVLEAEKIVFDPYLPIPIAGTIDLLARSKKNGNILILDWKTNEKIQMFNTFKKFMKHPIQDVPDLNYYHYTLQLSLYQKILISGGYFPKGTKFQRAIIHLKDTGWTCYELQDYTSKIEAMLSCF